MIRASYSKCHCGAEAVTFSNCCGWECENCSSPSCRGDNFA